MEDALKPHQEGVVSKGPSVLDANGFIRKHEMRFPASVKTLAGYAEEFVFFTPAILYLHGGFMDAPFADLMAVTGIDLKLYYKKFERPLFRGLEAPSNGNPDWNHALWAVRREFWQPLSDWLVSLTLTYRLSEAVAGVGEQHLTILDPLAADRMVLWPSTVPTINIASFGLRGSMFTASLSPPPAPLAGLPALSFGRPAKAMAVFAAALYDGKNPVNAAAYHQWRESLKDGPNEDQA